MKCEKGSKTNVFDASDKQQMPITSQKLSWAKQRGPCEVLENTFGSMCSTLIIYINNRQVLRMMSGQVEINDYYGYNSIINCEGRRIRRMRRTQASAQKLIHERVKSPCISREPSSKRSRASPIQRSDLSGSVNRRKGDLKFYREKIASSSIQKQGQSYHTVSNFGSEKSKEVGGMQSVHALRRLGGVSEAMGEYYVGSFPKLEEKSTKQQLNSHKSSRRQKDLYDVKPLQSNSGGGYLTANCSSKRTLKKTEKSYEIKPFQLQQNMYKTKRNEQAQLEQASLLKKRSSNIQSRLSKSNSRLSEVSSMGKSNSRASQSALSNSEQLTSKLKRNHVKFDQQALMKSSDLKKDNSIKEEQSQRGHLSKKSSVNIELPSQMSSLSQDCSKLQSYAESLRSKIKSSQDRSKISKLNEFIQAEEEVKSPIPKGKAVMMTKTSTQTTQSDETHRKTNQYLKTSKKINQKEVNKRPIIASEQKPTNNLDKKDSQIENEESSIESGGSSKVRSKVGNQQKNSIKFSIGVSGQKPGQVCQSLRCKKKKSLSSYTFNDVVQSIQEHEIRICSLYLFVDSTKALYETPLKFERYERLCFLMLKKYKFEKNRIVESIKGGQSCFTLSEAEIPTEVLKKHASRSEVKERLAAFVEEGKKLSLEVEAFFNSINKRYQKDKYIKLETARDTFSPEVMRLLMEELTKLYLELQKEDIENDVVDSNQQRIIEIVEIMFLISELNGRFVKPFELFQENQVDFEQYYAQNYERIMETAEYFEKYA